MVNVYNVYIFSKMCCHVVLDFSPFPWVIFLKCTPLSTLHGPSECNCHFCMFTAIDNIVCFGISNVFSTLNINVLSPSLNSVQFSIVCSHLFLYKIH